MKKLRLSDPSSRIFCIIGDLVLLGAIAALLMLRSTEFSFELFVVVCGILLILLIIYSFAVFRSVLIIDPDAKSVTVILPMQKNTYNISTAVSVGTREVQLEQHVTRALVLLDAQGAEACVIPTFITGNRGARNEILAMAVAKALGLAFNATVDETLYDKKARRAKQAAQREEAKRLRLEKRILSRTHTQKEKDEVVLGHKEPDINYDDHDDLK